LATAASFQKPSPSVRSVSSSRVRFSLATSKMTPQGLETSLQALQGIASLAQHGVPRVFDPAAEHQRFRG
jgi:hypothetical protein